MKKFLLILPFISLVMAISCQKEGLDKEKEFCQYLPDIIENNSTWLGNLKLPRNTTIIQHDSTYFEAILPGNVFIVHKEPGGRLNYVKKESYTCTCSGSGGCTVYYGENIGFGCQHSNCTGTCTGSKGAATMNSFGLIDFDQKISFVVDSSEIPELFEFNELLFEIPEVIKSLKEFVEKNNIIAKVTESTNYCAINLFGCLAFIPEPAVSVKVIKYVKPNFSCKCGTGPAGCTKDSHWSGIIYCHNTVCTSCTMTLE